VQGQHAKTMPELEEVLQSTKIQENDDAKVQNDMRMVCRWRGNIDNDNRTRSTSSKITSSSTKGASRRCLP